MISELKNIRKQKKISGHELAKVLGYKSPATYYKKENGIIPITYKEMKIISEYLKESPEKIFFKNWVSY